MVSASNRCEVDRQRSSTQELFNAINILGGLRATLDYWYRCMQQQYWVCYTD